MLSFNLSNFLIYFSIAWGTNIALNFLYVIKRYFPRFNDFDYPIDFKIKCGARRLFGDSTTIIGLILSLIISLLINMSTGTLVWTIIPPIIYLGHLMGSFIKRRMNKGGGEFVPVIDHGDYMLLLGIIFISCHYVSLLFALLALILTYILHPLACIIAFKLKLREHPY
ncbi:MAG: CDP-archaeol synthase [Patescibacteria group bacterium]